MRKHMVFHLHITEVPADSMPDHDSAGEDSFPDTLGIEEVGDRGGCYGDQECGGMPGGPVSVAT